MCFSYEHSHLKKVVEEKIFINSVLKANVKSVC